MLVLFSLQVVMLVSKSSRSCRENVRSIAVVDERHGGAGMSQLETLSTFLGPETRRAKAQAHKADWALSSSLPAKKQYMQC